MTATLVAIGYAVGWVLAIVVAARIMEREFGPLDGADVGGAIFFALYWPIFLPFAGLTWAVMRLLPLLGVGVKP